MTTRSTHEAVVVGAGIGGLVAALMLACEGVEVVVVEKQRVAGGKMREISMDGMPIDSGPTVLTMLPVFEEIFARAGAAIGEHLALRPAGVLGRHAWGDRTTLDLFADFEQSVDAVGAFAGAAEAKAFRSFSLRAERAFAMLERTFIRAANPSLPNLVRRSGLAGLMDLVHVNPFASLWSVLGKHFRDPRLRQVFGRYATYSGSSPFSAPAVLMLIAHVEREGVWVLDGGIHSLAKALVALCERQGVVFRYGAEVRRVVVSAGRATAVELTDGEIIEGRSVICNADAAAIAGGLFGRAASGAVNAVSPDRRSLSALTWSLLGEVEGFSLVRHNVFFSSDYQREFSDIFAHGQLPADPTVYVCAQDRDDCATAPTAQRERLFCLVNAPANGDTRSFDPSEIQSCEERTFQNLRTCGLKIRRSAETTLVTTPNDFNLLYPGSGGALYGQATHGWRASFQRPLSRSRLPGLYLAGGGVHPGAGLPMAALSGRFAAMSILEDLASTSQSRRTATRGGTSTPSAMTARTGSR